ncbi:MAG: chorismate mutase [Clostridia bacterium]|nr:chorismate mutase [Clostridia bacterium]
MSISDRIAAAKKKACLPVENPEREAEILEDITAKAAPAFAPYSSDFFRELFRLSKEYQNSVMDEEIYGLIGHPLPHSFSKEVHEALGEYGFSLFDLTPEEMRAFVSSRSFRGLSITRPYKQDVIPMCDRLTSLAGEIGAVNTLYFDEGRLVGHNTDYDGFLYTAQRSGIDFNGRIVLILGTGGTSRTVYRACVDKGAVAVLFASRGEGDGRRVFSYDDLPAIAGQIEIIVNTTPVGTYPGNLESVISLRDFPRCSAVVDVVYNPFRTALLLEAEALGLKTANGMPMIVAQAMEAAGRFLGRPGGFIEKTEEILKHLEGRMGNIVLIGMPGCGKSTAGKKLAEMTGRSFIDLDEEIVAETKKTIPELFSEFGETFFRKVETMVARKAGAEHGQIIATGGGIVLNDENYRALKQNGTIVWLTRAVDQLPVEGRPLSENLSVLEQMAGERYELYRKWADFIISSDEFMNY